MSGVTQREVEADGHEQRLDRWFRRHYPHVTQGRLEKMCRKGEIRVDGGRVKSGTRLTEGQIVRVPPLPVALPTEQKTVLEPSSADAQMMNAAVLYRDEHIIAINKPPGLPTQGGTGQHRHVDGLAEVLNPGGPRPKLVHRLDKDTSGVLLLALSGRAAAALPSLSMGARRESSIGLQSPGPLRHEWGQCGMVWLKLPAMGHMGRVKRW